ncbi:MAG: hypothetical protein UDG28_10025 [Prevotellamassilia sp.]|nr:hypothetical protein [Prevotellamassilia sp.]
MKKRIYNIPQLFHLNALFTKVVALIMVATLSGMMPVNAQVNAQVTGNKYLESYGSGWNKVNTTKIEIQHKPAKWFEIRKNIGMSDAAKNMDTFNDEQSMFEADMSSTEKLQASHVYVDTIYVKKGSIVELSLPTGFSSMQISTNSYHRWYSYRTGKTFRVNNPNKENVYDLLTPEHITVNNERPNYAYRFGNGYVVAPMYTYHSGKVVPYTMNFYYPKNEEFERWVGEIGSNTYRDNRWYMVACDVSSYNDFSKEYTSKPLGNVINRFLTNKYEPTLSGRVLFYIVGVDENTTNDEKRKNDIGRLSKPEYQGATSNNIHEKLFLEEYDLHLPAYHLSNNTDELVTLSKDARGYAVPGADKDATELIVQQVKVEKTDVDLDIIDSKLSTSLDKTNRVIRFRKKGIKQYERWSVADGSAATIIVTKNVGGKIYNIARFNLHFHENSRLLTQTQVSKIGTPGVQKQKWNYRYRSPKYMLDNLQLLTELDFDYDPSVASLSPDHQPEYYPFPMAWENSSYAFYDGSISKHAPNSSMTEWGSYSIVNDYIGYGDSGRNNNRPPTNLENSKDNNSTYFMYVDVSDRPGVIARLPFRDKLCAGSEMMVTAWVKSAGQEGHDSNDAGLLFTVMGVKEQKVTVDGKSDTIKTYTPIYRHLTGQIRTTTYNDNGEPGQGSKTNEWMQTYFSFVNKHNANEFDSYVLQVDNYSASSSGGDVYLDEIRVFLMKPSAKITQMDQSCANERTLMNMDFDWERLTSRLGIKEGDGEDPNVQGISFCFLDELKYRQAIHGKENPTHEEKIAAIKASYQQIGSNKQIEGSQEYFDYKVATLYFKPWFTDNTPYIGTLARPCLAKDNRTDGRSYFYGRTDEAGVRSLSCDFYSKLSPNRPYIMLIVPNNPNVTTAKPGTDEHVKAWTEEFAKVIGAPCAIETRFFVQGQTQVMMDGEIVDPSLDYCAGQEYVMSFQMRIPVITTEGRTYVDIPQEFVFYDWFFGSEEEFVLPNEQGLSVAQSLLNFREFYDHETTELTKVVPQKREDGTEFTQADLDLLVTLVESKKLTLSKQNLSISIPENGLNLCVQPIKTKLLKEQIEGTWPGRPENVDVNLICWNYLPLHLSVNSKAPELSVGFNHVQYPHDYLNPCLRIGKKQIEKANDANSPLIVNICRAKLVSKTSTHLAPVTSLNERCYLYLAETSDPAYKKVLQKASEEHVDIFDEKRRMGVLKALKAHAYNPSSRFDDCMEIYFYTDKFKPKEGYYYHFTVLFEEKDANDKPTNACFGKMTFRMKVVPEYVVWQGGNAGRTKNWNNDANWKRADNADLHYSAAEYSSNQANTTDEAFVPMHFTKVLMPAGSKARLYMSGYKQGGNQQWGWDSPQEPTDMETATPHIEYDLMAYDNDAKSGLVTKRFRVNICDRIHFLPGAEIENADYLIYNHASLDVNLQPNHWQLVSLPLKGTVAGDWYTDSQTHSQAELPLFKDVTFGANNNRYNPEIYQRSWDSSAQIIEQGQNTIHATLGSKWSTAFNDAAVPYAPGLAYSVKGLKNDKNNQPFQFRFPKADTEYGIATAKPLDRTGAGRLFISDFVDRSNPNIFDKTEELVVRLSPSAEGYALVGNPFLAPLYLDQFFFVNSNLEPKYWTVNPDGTVVAGQLTSDSETGKHTWVTADGTGVPVLMPGCGMYVKKSTIGIAHNDIAFKHEMQNADTQTQTAHTGWQSFSIKAQGSQGGASTASLAYAATATDSETDDVMLLDDEALRMKYTPLVYTVAGTKATAINLLVSQQQIPIGVFGEEGEEAVLTFNHVDKLKSPILYDAQTNTETPLTEGMQVSVSLPSHGRYFLRTLGGEQTAIEGVEKVDAQFAVNVYSVQRNEVIVASEAPIRSISVYTLNGQLLQQYHAEGVYSSTLSEVHVPICIVKVTTDAGSVSRKLAVKQ